MCGCWHFSRAIGHPRHQSNLRATGLKMHYVRDVPPMDVPVVPGMLPSKMLMLCTNKRAFEVFAPVDVEALNRLKTPWEVNHFNYLALSEASVPFPTVELSIASFTAVARWLVFLRRPMAQSLGHVSAWLSIIPFQSNRVIRFLWALKPTLQNFKNQCLRHQDQ